MMLQGVYVDSEGKIHQFYEAEASQYYRLDICTRGTPFQTDPSGVEYSIFKKKSTYVYGDEKVYREYLEMKDAIYNAKGVERQESRWSEGKYFIVKTKDNDAQDFHSRTTICNGDLQDFEVFIGERFYRYNVLSQAVTKMDPLNIVEYTEKTIEVGGKDNATYTTPYYPYDVLIRRYDLNHILEKDLVVADNPMVAEQRLQQWYESDAPYKGFDTETTGLDVWKYGDDELVGIILSIGKDISTYFPFRMKEMPNLPKSFMDKLMRYAIEQEDRLVAHNKQFDRQVMLKEGYDIRIKWDTLRVSFMLNPVTVKGTHGLKELIYQINGKKFLELSEIFISPKNIDFSVLPKDITRIYACVDSTNAVEVLEDLLPKVPDSMWPILLIEMALSDLKADQEFYGMRVDIQKYKENYDNCNYIIDLLINTFRRMTREDGNINSPEVLSTLMYDKLGCKVLLRTKTGRRSTSGKAIDKLANVKADKPHNITEDIVDLKGNVVIKAEKLANSKYPALVILSKYREYNKRKTAFYARFERTLKVGRVHFWINQNGASSGRQSSPMHQLPPELKDVMLSDSEYKDLWGPDYSQVELRMIAYLAKETELIEMCCNPDNDVHRVCASLITGKEMWEITKAERNIKKRVNFGVVYLISGYGLAGQLYGPGYTEEQVKYCQEQLDSFYKRFKRIDYYLKKNAATVQSRGYMKTAFNRVKYFKEIFDPDITAKKRASLVRQANNMPVQGTAADLMKIAEVNMYNWIRERGWDKLDKDGLPLVRVMLSIHDEVLLSASRSLPMEEVIEMITKCMDIELQGAPPFFVAPAKMDDWGGHSNDSLAIPIHYRDQLIEDYNRTDKSVFRRSIYDVGMDADKRAEMNESGLLLADKVKKYLPYATFTKVSGDYSDELDDKAKKVAFKAFVESGFKVYVDENYVELLDAYRDKVLHEYMSNLINKYGPDPYNVGIHVRHASLTHELLARFDKDLRGKDLTHEEQINYATKLYMEKHAGDQPVVEEEEEIVVRATMDKDLFYEQSENIYQFDKDGNIIYEEEVEEDEDDIADSDVEYILFRTEGKVFRVWKLVDQILLDVDRLSMSQIDDVIAEAWKYRDPKGFYSVKLLLNGNMIDTKFRVEDMNVDEMSEYILKLEKIVA